MTTLHDREHPLRRQVAAELHARPFESVRAPLLVSHLALLGDDAGADRHHVAALCEALEQRTPRDDATLHSVDLGAFRLRWERHTEFSSYTFFVRDFDAPALRPFGQQALSRVPEDWRAALPGELIAAVHLVLEATTTPERQPDEVMELFRTENVAGSLVADGGARVFTDFRLHGDGFGRILVQDLGLPAPRTGRLVQRLLEIETYRLLALLAFPVARSATSELGQLEQRLHELTARMADHGDVENARTLLAEISGLSADLARSSTGSDYRLSAARAYHELVRHRIDNLREQRLRNLQTIGEFMERRFEPAMKTCHSAADRQEALSRRLSRAADLLSTRVDVALEAQNRDLLASMNRRTGAQLRLQQTVEGLSVVVLGYYSTGLIAYMLRGLEAAGFRFNVEITLGILAPLVVVSVWLLVRTIRRRIMARLDADAEP